MRTSIAIGAWASMGALLSCQSQGPPPAALTADEAVAIAAEAGRAVDDYRDAIQRLDVDAMLTFWAEDPGVVMAGDGTLIEGFAAVAERIRAMMAEIEQMPLLETWNPHTYVLGPNAASLAHEWRWALVGAAGDTTRAHGSWLYVLKRFDDGWKCVHSAGTHLPG